MEIIDIITINFLIIIGTFGGFAIGRYFRIREIKRGRGK